MKFPNNIFIVSSGFYKVQHKYSFPFEVNFLDRIFKTKTGGGGGRRVRDAGPGPL